MKTSSKNFITMGIFWAIAIIWNAGGAVATSVGKASIGFWIVTIVFFVLAFIFAVGGIGAQNAEDKADKK